MKYKQQTGIQIFKMTEQIIQVRKTVVAQTIESTLKKVIGVLRP